MTNACEPARLYEQGGASNPRFLFSAAERLRAGGHDGAAGTAGLPGEGGAGRPGLPGQREGQRRDSARWQSELAAAGRFHSAEHAAFPIILVENGAVCGAELEDGTRLEGGSRSIVATGGFRAIPPPAPRATDFRWMAELGHTVYPPSCPPSIALDLTARDVGFRACRA